MRFEPFTRRCVVIACVLAATLLGTRGALAWCPAVTERIPDAWPQDQKCFLGSDGAGALSVFWRNACVGYDLQRDASKKVSLDQATAVAASAFARWKNVVCSGGGHPSIDPTYDLGPVACTAVQYNETQPNQNVIVFRDDVWPYPGDTYNTIGLTRLKFDKGTGEIFDADMEINTADHDVILQGTPTTASEVLLESVITHEAGHFLGLAHSTDNGAIMFARYEGHAPDLSPDDIDGICAIYPPDGKRMTSAGFVDPGPCDATPRHGFSSACGSPDGGASPITVNETPMHRSGCSVSGFGALGHPPFVIAALGWVLARRRRMARTKSHFAQVTIE